MLLPSAYPFMVKQNGGVSWVNDPRSNRMSSLKMSLWIMSTFVKWKFHELIFWTAHFQQLWAHGILSSLFLVKWVPGVTTPHPPMVERGYKVYRDFISTIFRVISLIVFISSLKSYGSSYDVTTKSILCHIVWNFKWHYIMWNIIMKSQ